MNTVLKNFSQSLRLFLSEGGKYILFTALFYSIWLVKSVFQNQQFDLHSFSGRMIGIATLENYDVSARVSLFYKCITILLCSFAAFNVVGYFISKRFSSLIKSPEAQIVNYSSLAGIFFFLFSVFGYKMYETFELVYFAHKLMLAGILLKLIFFPKSRLTIYDYTLVILLSVSVYFFIADCFLLSGQLKNPDFLITTFILCILCLVGLNFILKTTPLTAERPISTLTYSLWPLAFLPFISVLKAEIFLVFKTNGIHLNSPTLIFCLLIIILFFIIFVRYRKSQKQFPVSQKRLVSHYYFPLIIFSLITYVNYSYFINWSSEAFEAGNKYLPVMEFKLFGVIPTLEKFNSHLLSDYFFSSIYTFFNGLQGSEMELYDFLYTSLTYVLYYYLVYYLSRNAFISAFFILLFPLCTSMLPEPFSFAVFSIFALHKIIFREPKLKNYLLFFIAIAFLVVWRIDLGYTCLVVMVLLLLYYHFISPGFKISWLLLFKATGLVLGCTILFIAFLSGYRGVNLFEKIMNALQYFASAQAYGYSTVGQENTATFKMHYFIFPVITGIIILALLLNFKNLNRSVNQRLSYLTLLFICIFYLINFNRGLIRHSLYEKIDFFTSSFIFILLPGAVFVFSQNRTHVYRFAVACGISFFLLISYKLPNPEGSKSYLEKCIAKTQTPDSIDLVKIGSRVKTMLATETDKTTPFIDFINKNTKPGETFIDFSDNPMLYFYTKKITPSYFYQNPLSSHNDFLQKVFLKDLENYNTPYLVFSRGDGYSYDMVDEIPNTLRHYRLAEYFFQNFSPYITAGLFSVWKRNNVPDKNIPDTLYSIKKGETPDSILTAKFKARKGKKYAARIVQLKKDGINLSIHSPGNPTGYELKFENDTVAFGIIDVKNGPCTVQLQNQNGNITNFQVLEYENIPDFYPEAPQSYDFMWLPQIWGKYDKTVSKEPVLFQSGKPAGIDKSSGNTVRIYCRNTSKKNQKAVLWFVNTNEKDTTFVSFNVAVSKKEELYAIRISSIYTWYSGKLANCGVKADSTVVVSKIQITKGS